MDQEAQYFPIEESFQPTSPQEVAEIVAGAARQGRAVYPVGGGTQLALGAPGRRSGIALKLTGLNRVVDYPSRDLTVTVQAGMTLANLQQILGEHNQWLPLGAPEPERATIGGILSTNWPSLRQSRYGGAADFLLAAKAVDGTGSLFSCGARVVKNAAGYNLPRLLVGGFGGLAVLTEMTLMVRPRPETCMFLVGTCQPLEAAEQFLRTFGRRIGEVAAVQLLVGQIWRSCHPVFDASSASRPHMWIAVAFEGSVPEVSDLQAESQTILGESAKGEIHEVPSDDAASLWRCLENFSGRPPAGVDESADDAAGAVLLQVRTLSDRAVCVCRQFAELPQTIAIQSDLAGGTTWAWVKSTKEEFPSLWTNLLGKMRTLGGKMVIAWHKPSWRLTAEMVWGEPPGEGAAEKPARKIITRLKRQFDPQGILNPGRLLWT